MQISSKTITKAKQKQINDQLHTVIADLKSESDVAAFLKDFLTTTEYAVLAKRLDIAMMLNAGKSYQDIKKELKVSSATISSVSELISKKGIKLALQKIKVDEWAENTAAKISGWFGKK